MDRAGQSTLFGERGLDEFCRCADSFWRIGLSGFQQTARQPRPQGPYGVYQARALGTVRALDFYRGDFRLLSHVHGESYVDDFARVVDFYFRVDTGLEVSVLVKEVSQRSFGDWDAGGVVGLFVGKIGDLQEASVGEIFHRAGKFHYTHVEGGLKQEVDSKSGDFGLDADVDFGETAGLLQGLRRGFDGRLVIGRARLLSDERKQRFQVTMRIGDERNGADILSVVSRLRFLGCKLCARKRAPEQKPDTQQTHTRPPNPISINTGCAASEYHCSLSRQRHQPAGM